MWFSAHYHLGHAHSDSQTELFGTHFFMTGVHSPATRDGDRHSRIIDLHDDRVVVRTLCHENRAIDDRHEWARLEPISAMVGTRTIRGKELQFGALRGVGFTPNGEALVPGNIACVERTSLVDATPVEGGLAVVPSGNALVATEEGALWEVQMDLQSVVGTLHLGEPLSHVRVSGDIVWMAEGNRLWHASASDKWRFIRARNGTHASKPLEFDETIVSLEPDGNGGVNVALGGSAWFASVGEAGAERIAAVDEVDAAPSAQSVALSGGDVVQLVDGQLHIIRLESNDRRVLNAGGRVHAICPTASDHEFLAVVSFPNQARHSEVQRWRRHSTDAPSATYEVYAPRGWTPEVRLEASPGEGTDEVAATIKPKIGEERDAGFFAATWEAEVSWSSAPKGSGVRLRSVNAVQRRDFQ